MRLRTLAPLHLNANELARRQQRYRRLAPAPLLPLMANLPDRPEVPRSLAGDADCRASEDEVYRAALATDPRDFDAVLLDCVLDPALERLEADAPVPVFGLLRLAAGYLTALGHSFVAVTRNHAIADELEARLRAYRLEHRYRGRVVLDLDFDAIADGERWRAALRQALAPLASSPVSAVINGCSAVDPDKDAAGASGAGCASSVGNLLIVDPTALALELIAHAAAGGLLPTSPPESSAPRHA